MLEVRILYTFLKLVYDPYWDGTAATMDLLVHQAVRLGKDIKALQRELVEDPDKYLEGRKRLQEGAWSVEQVVKEIFDLSGNFKEYLYSLAKHPIESIHSHLQGPKTHPDLAGCTFRPQVNALSAKIDAKSATA